MAGVAAFADNNELSKGGKPRTNMLLLLYLVLGAFAGLIAGLFGVGGGLIIVPALLIAFAWQGISPEVATHLAIGTSLATIIVTSISSVHTHHRRGAVDWVIVVAMAAGIATGSVLGVFTARGLSGPALQFAFGIFALLIAAQMGFGLSASPNRELPARMGLFGAGGVVGWVSALFGIGGGSLTVPFLSWCNVPMQRAVATSAACGLPIAIVGASTNVVAGWQHPALPEWSSGFIYWPAFTGIVISSFIFARIGAKLAHLLSPLVLKRCFAVFLMAIGLRLIFTSGVIS